jgi:hypothetical protein
MTITIRSSKVLLYTPGATQDTNFIYMRIDRPLPAIGDEVVVESAKNGHKFAGKVIAVDPKAHGYYARVDLGEKV